MGHEFRVTLSMILGKSRIASALSRPKILDTLIIEKFIGLPCSFSSPLKLRSSTPYRNGTTPVVFEHLEFFAKLAALVP